MTNEDAAQGVAPRGEESSSPGGARRKRHRRVVRPGTEKFVVGGQTLDDQPDPVERKAAANRDDAALRQRYLIDRPPHWRE